MRNEARQPGKTPNLKTRMQPRLCRAEAWACLATSARHFRFMTLEMIADGFEKIAVFNILLYPYQRSTKLTGDGLCYAFIGHDIHTSLRTLLRLSAGRNVAHRVSVNSFLEQGRNSAGFFSFVTRMFSKFPHMTERVNSLVSFSRRQGEFGGVWLGIKRVARRVRF